MSASTKLSTSVKALCYLAKVHSEPKTSSQIAESIGVNASKLRKILSMLVKNNIVESTQGASGGFLLKKEIDKLHLQEIEMHFILTFQRATVIIPVKQQD
jgi:Rrf2 family protein